MSQTESIIKTIDVPLDQIKPSPYQPRLNFNLDDIRDSIQKDGILVPITVRDKGDHFELVDGERRTRLSQELGYDTISCTVIDIDDETARRMVYKINKIRKNYTPYEEAVFFNKLVEEEKMKPYEIETQLRVDHHWVQACLNVWKLPKDLQDNVFGLGRDPIPYRIYLTDIRSLETEILRNVDEAVEILRQIIDKRMTVDEKREIITRRRKKINEETITEATKAIEKIVPEPKPLETSKELEKAAEVLIKEAKRRKTPEQIHQENVEKARKNLDRISFTEAENLGINTKFFEKQLLEIDNYLEDKPIDALSDIKTLQRELKAEITEVKRSQKEREKKLIEANIQKRIEEEAKRRAKEIEEAERKRLEAESEAKLKADRERLEIEAEAKLEVEKERLRKDREFISEVRREIISPPFPKTEREKSPLRIIKSIDGPVHTISVGLDRETFMKLSNFMKTRDMMPENAIIYLIKKGLESLTVDES